MRKIINIGIIICDRYRRCSGGKCFRALKKREGAFSIYKEKPIELVGYTTCDGCPGGNIEYAIDEMKTNGVERIHVATGLLVGYPPCPYIEYFRDYIKIKYDIPVIFGTHPIPEKYFKIHEKLGTLFNSKWKNIIMPNLMDKKLRKSYD